MANKVINPAPIIKQLADRCLKSKGLECSILGTVIDRLRAAPAVDAVGVVHGRWIPIQLGDPHSVYECSVCGRDYLTDENGCRLLDNLQSEYMYCPNCGAKMDGDGNDI